MKLSLVILMVVMATMLSGCVVLSLPGHFPRITQDAQNITGVAMVCHRQPAIPWGQHRPRCHKDLPFIGFKHSF